MFIRSQNKDFSLKEISECNTESNLIDTSYSKRKYCVCKMLGILSKRKCFKTVKCVGRTLTVSNTLTIKIFSGMYNNSGGLLLKNGHGQPYFGFGWASVIVFWFRRRKPKPPVVFIFNSWPIGIQTLHLPIFPTHVQPVNQKNNILKLFLSMCRILKRLKWKYTEGIISIAHEHTGGILQNPDLQPGCHRLPFLDRAHLLQCQHSPT